MPKTLEFTLLPPKLLPLTPERERAAVRALTELLLDGVAEGRPGVLGSGSDGALGGGSGVVVAFRVSGEKARKAA
jgi:hypothetical protein